MRRRTRWADTAEALRHFAAKPVFARWDPRVLADYVAAGTMPAEGGGVTLAFDRDVETRIYNTLPDHFDDVLRHEPPRCPVRFLGGTTSVEVRQVGLAATRSLTGDRLRWMEGGHLFPMEQPEATADAVLEELAAMTEETAR